MSTVIKAGQSSKLLHRPAAVDLADHLGAAQQVVEEARARAADVLARAEAEARQIRAAARNEAQQAGFNQGREQGHKEGLEAGTQEGRREAFEQAKAAFENQHSHLVADLQRAVAELNGIRETIRADAERNVLDFAIRLATKLTYATGELSPAAARANVARALELVHERTNVSVRMHSDDLAALEQLTSGEVAQLQSGRDVRLIADESITRGGCVVQTPRTEVDATLETQIAEITSLLLGAAKPPETKEAASS